MCPESLHTTCCRGDSLRGHSCGVSAGCLGGSVSAHRQPGETPSVEWGALLPAHCLL